MSEIRTPRDFMRHMARVGGAGTVQAIKIEGLVPVPYSGSVVPHGFKCRQIFADGSPCKGSVITAWLYYYHPQDSLEGEWGGQCQRCGWTYTKGQMANG